MAARGGDDNGGSSRGRPGRSTVSVEERIAELLEALESWELAYRNAAVTIRTREVKVPRTSAGSRNLSDDRRETEWRNLRDSKTTFRSARESQAAFRVLRRRATPETHDPDLRLAECWSELRRRTSEMLGYGDLLERVTGIPGRALRHLADPMLLDDAVGRGPHPAGDAMFGIYGVGLSDRARRGADLPSKETVKSVQGVLARLASDYSRAQSRLEQVAARRAAALAAQDKAVAAAQCEVDRSIAEMASALGPELTASVLEMRLSDVRRLVKATREDKRVCD